jgi:hypothetical protein
MQGKFSSRLVEPLLRRAASPLRQIRRDPGSCEPTFSRYKGLGGQRLASLLGLADIDECVCVFVLYIRQVCSYGRGQKPF